MTAWIDFLKEIPSDLPELEDLGTLELGGITYHGSSDGEAVFISLDDGQTPSVCLRGVIRLKQYSKKFHLDLGFSIWITEQLSASLDDLKELDYSIEDYIEENSTLKEKNRSLLDSSNLYDSLKSDYDYVTNDLRLARERIQDLEPQIDGAKKHAVRVVRTAKLSMAAARKERDDAKSLFESSSRPSNVLDLIEESELLKAFGSSVDSRILASFYKLCGSLKGSDLESFQLHGDLFFKEIYKVFGERALSDSGASRQAFGIPDSDRIVKGLERMEREGVVVVGVNDNSASSSSSSYSSSESDSEEEYVKRHKKKSAKKKKAKVKKDSKKLSKGSKGKKSATKDGLMNLD